MADPNPHLYLGENVGVRKPLQGSRSGGRGRGRPPGSSSRGKSRKGSKQKGRDSEKHKQEDPSRQLVQRPSKSPRQITRPASDFLFNPEEKREAEQLRTAGKESLLSEIGHQQRIEDEIHARRNRMIMKMGPASFTKTSDFQLLLQETFVACGLSAQHDQSLQTIQDTPMEEEHAQTEISAGQPQLDSSPSTIPAEINEPLQNPAGNTENIEREHISDPSTTEHDVQMAHSRLPENTEFSEAQDTVHQVIQGEENPMSSQNPGADHTEAHISEVLLDLQRGEQAVSNSTPPVHRNILAVSSTRPSHIQKFRNSDCEKVYSSKYSRFEVLHGRPVDFQDLDDIKHLFEIQGLVEFLTSPSGHLYYPVLPAEFYANLEIREDHISGWFRNSVISLGPDTLQHLLHIPNRGIDIFQSISDFSWTYPEINEVIAVDTAFPKRLTKVTQLNPTAKFIALVLCNSFFQRKGHPDELGQHIYKAVYAVMLALPINWAQIFRYHLRNVKTKLFYGNTLAKLVECMHIDLSNISHTNLNLKAISIVEFERRKRSAKEVIENFAARPATSTAASLDFAIPAALPAQLQALTDRCDKLQQDIEDVHSHLEAVRKDARQIHQDQDSKLFFIYKFLKDKFGSV